MYVRTLGCLIFTHNQKRCMYVSIRVVCFAFDVSYLDDSASHSLSFVLRLRVRISCTQSYQHCASLRHERSLTLGLEVIFSYHCVIICRESINHFRLSLLEVILLR